MSKSPSEIASTFLLDLARGKYNSEIRDFDTALQLIATTFPAAAPASLIAKKVMDSFIQINSLTAPQHVVPDGAGGWVPSTNSRIGPGGNFNHDTAASR